MNDSATPSRTARIVDALAQADRIEQLIRDARDVELSDRPTASQLFGRRHRRDARAARLARATRSRRAGLALSTARYPRRGAGMTEWVRGMTERGRG